MRNLKPKLTIDNFTGSGDGNILYNEGFLPEIINGKSVITSGIISNVLLGSGSLYGTLTLGNIVSFLNLKRLNTNQTNYILLRSNTGKIFSSSLIPATSKVAKAEIHTIADSYPDMFELEDNNIIYSAGDKLGYGLRGLATGGSTTTLIDTTKNFTTLGFAANDKVTNLRTGAEYTISSISTTTNTNDTLNFSAFGSLTTASEDEYILWDDARFDLLDNVSAENWQGGATTNWRRQIKQYADKYLILNGNYLSELSADGATIIDNKKQLPLKHQALCFDVNSDKILVSAEYKNGGRILLWDGRSDGWSNSLGFDFPIKAVVSYKSGWLFVSRGVLYYTDGYQIQELSKLDSTPDIDRFVAGIAEPLYNSGLFYFDGKLYFASSYNDYNFIDNGVYCYDFKSGWTLIKQVDGSNSPILSGIPYCVGYCNYRTAVFSAGNGFFNEIRSHRTYSSSEANYSFIYYINLPEPTVVKSVGLNIIRPVKRYNEDRSIKQTTIAVNIGDGKRGLIERVYNSDVSGTGNNDLIKLNGTLFYGNEVGDEVIIKDITSGNNLYGQRRYISSIANIGEATEQWTLDEDLSSDLGMASQIQVIKVKKLDKKVIKSNELNKEILFSNTNSGFLSNKLFIEVVVWDSFDYTPMPISISNINVYGD